MRKYLQIIHVGLSQSLRPGLGCARQGTGVAGSRGASLLALPAGPRKSCPPTGGVWRAGVGHRPTLGLQPLPHRRRRPPWHSRLAAVSVCLAVSRERPSPRWTLGDPAREQVPPDPVRCRWSIWVAPQLPKAEGQRPFPFPASSSGSPPWCASGEELCCGGAVVGEGGRRLSPRPWWRGGDCGGLGRD